MSGQKQDYQLVHNLIPFMEKFIQAESPYLVEEIRLVRDGSMLFRLRSGKSLLRLKWMETAASGQVLAAFGGGVIVCAGKPGLGEQRLRQLRRAAVHVANRLERLLRGRPPHLLEWRNRNPQKIAWNRRLFNNLCPGMLVKGQTRYFDYRVADINEYSGHLNVVFQSRKASVTVTLSLSKKGDGRRKPLITWGQVGMFVTRDERDSRLRRLPEHQVEEFMGYLLSRNLPPEFSLVFDFGDPPVDYLPDDWKVDFLVTRRLDDSSFFEMLLASSKEIAVVTSCDRECFNLFSLVASQKEDWTVSSPWPGHPRPDYLNHSYYVGFNAQEVIIGSNRAERCLEALVASRTPPEMIVYMDSCLHRIVGVDSRSFLERLQEKSRVPIVYYDIRTSQHPYLQQLKDFWRSLFQQLDESTSTSDPAGVVLLGVGTSEWLGLDDVCQRLGWRVLGHVFPSLDSAAVRNISRSSVLVANCWEYVRVIFSDMVKDLSQPLLSLPIPYGIEGTSQWLEKIHSRLLGEPPPLEGIDEIQSAGESFNRIRGDIAGRSVGLFSRWPGADIRLSPRIRFGVPLVDFFHELGLRICLHLYLASEEGEPAVEDVAARVGLKLDAGDEVVFFRSSSQLDELLLRGEFDLVFTEMLRDRRISRAGKIPLSVKQLHPGYAGAVKTARFIQGLLASGFYRRYRGMPVAHGERLPPRGGN